MPRLLSSNQNPECCFNLTSFNQIFAFEVNDTDCLNTVIPASFLFLSFFLFDHSIVSSFSPSSLLSPLSAYNIPKPKQIQPRKKNVAALLLYCVLQFRSEHSRFILYLFMCLLSSSDLQYTVYNGIMALTKSSWNNFYYMICHALAGTTKMVIH